VRRSVVALLVAVGAACGGSRAPSTWQPAPFEERPVELWSRQDEDRWIVLACENVVDSRGDLRCDALDRDQFRPDSCQGSFGKLRAAATSFRNQLAFRVLVVLLAAARSCDEVSGAFRDSIAVQYAPSSQWPVTNCLRPTIFSPFSLSPDEARSRRGADAIRFSDTPSSLAAPIEVCGVTGELTWLTRVACKDGTLPWGKDFTRAHDARAGSKSQKLHRCPQEEMSLDVYRVPCPEQTYEVYMDMYECGPGENF